MENVGRVTSLRRYEFRDRAGAPLVRGATDWVYVDRERGRPLRIPGAVRAALVRIVLADGGSPDRESSP